MQSKTEDKSKETAQASNSLEAEEVKEQVNVPNPTSEANPEIEWQAMNQQ